MFFYATSTNSAHHSITALFCSINVKCPSALIVIMCRIRIETLPNPSPFTFAPRWHLLTLWAFQPCLRCNYPMQRIKTLYEPKNALECRHPFSWPCGNGSRCPKLDNDSLLTPCRFADSTHWRKSADIFHALKNVRPCFPRASCASNHPKIMAQQKDTLLRVLGSSLGCPSALVIID